MAFNALTDFVPPWASEEEKEGKLVLRDPQLEILDAFENKGFKKIFIRWHRQLGKDITCWLLMSRHAILNPGNYIYIFPVQKQAKKALWNRTDDAMGRLIHFVHGGNKDMILNINENEMFMRFKAWNEKDKAWSSESTVQFMGMDGANVSANVGQTLRGAVLSEAAIYQDYPKLMGYLKPALKAKNGFLVVNSTPRGKNHFYRLEKQIEDSPKWFKSVWQNLWKDRPNFSGIYDVDEIWEDARETGQEDWEVEQEWGVSYDAKVQGSIYGSQLKVAEEEGRFLTDLPKRRNLPTYTYWDIGIKDAMVCWFLQPRSRGLTIVDYWEDWSGEGLDLCASMLKDKGYNYIKHRLPWDGARRSFGRKNDMVIDHFKASLKAFRVRGSTELPKNRDVSKHVGITRTKSRFHEYSWDISNPNVVQGIEHLKQHSRKRNSETGEYTEEENSRTPHIHAADAFRNLTSDTTQGLDIDKVVEPGGAYTSGVDDDSEW